MTTPAEEAHPPQTRWRVEIRDGDGWIPMGSPHTSSNAAHEAQAAWDESRPAWVDGAPVQRRVVRETTTYTVEPA